MTVYLLRYVPRPGDTLSRTRPLYLRRSARTGWESSILTPLSEPGMKAPPAATFKTRRGAENRRDALRHLRGRFVVEAAS